MLRADGSSARASVLASHRPAVGEVAQRGRIDPLGAMPRYLPRRGGDARPICWAQQLGVTLERAHSVPEFSLVQLSRAVELREVAIEFAVAVSERA